MIGSQHRQGIPTKLSLEQFVMPCPSRGRRGPTPTRNPLHARTRASDPWLPSSGTHADFPVELRSNSAALRAQATSITHLFTANNSATAFSWHRFDWAHPRSACVPSNSGAFRLLRLPLFDGTKPPRRLNVVVSTWL
jgi:hypothetical protein